MSLFFLSKVSYVCLLVRMSPLTYMSPHVRLPTRTSPRTYTSPYVRTSPLYVVHLPPRTYVSRT